ncbi:45649_t:CDS:2, partial [Gigaspora margarita]
IGQLKLEWQGKFLVELCLHDENIVHQKLNDYYRLWFAESSDNSIASRMYENLQSPHEYKWVKYSVIYIFGVLFWELSSGIPPFRALKNTFGQEFEYTSFENNEKIGQRGFGVIYKAYSKDVNQIVALKTLNHNDKHSLDDFIRE